GGDASTVYVNNKLTSAIKPAGWLTWTSSETNPGGDSRYAEYGSTDLAGNPMDTSGRVAWSHQLTAAQAAAYTVANIFSRESAYSWYGLGYPASDTEPGSSTPAFTTGTGSADPNDP